MVSAAAAAAAVWVAAILASIVVASIDVVAIVVVSTAVRVRRQAARRSAAALRVRRPAGEGHQGQQMGRWRRLRRARYISSASGGPPLKIGPNSPRARERASSQTTERMHLSLH